MSKLRQTIEKLRNVTIGCNVEQAEKQANDFIKKWSKKAEKEYKIIIPDAKKIEARNYVYWLFIDYGLNWPFKKEPLKKLEVFLVAFLKELGVNVIE